jgi:hypothetical protein
MNWLRTYEQKRRFDQTPEPKPEKKDEKSKRRFVVHKHRARNLHYDFRIEANGVLKVVGRSQRAFDLSDFNSYGAAKRVL